MDSTVMNEAVQLISSVGFPIVCVMFLWKYVNTTMKEFTDTMREVTQTLTKLMQKMDDIDWEGKS